MQRILLRGLLTAAFVLLWNPAWALYNQASKKEKFGADCIGAVTMMGPKLGTCTIAGDKTRIWCPNGLMFQGDKDHQSVPLIRSICNLPQVP